MGVFVCFEEQVTKPMRLEAKEAGYYDKKLFGTRYDKIQIKTVEELLDGGEIDMPIIMATTMKSAERKSEQSQSAIDF